MDAPFFNRVEIPIAMGLLLLTGVGPLIAWRRSSVESLRRAFLWPMVGGVVVAVVLAALGIHHFYALVSFGLCTFVAVTVAIEFYKGADAIHTKSGTNFISAMVELTHRNTRRYGGYLVHMAIVLMFIGFTGKAFNINTTVGSGAWRDYPFGPLSFERRGRGFGSERQLYLAKTPGFGVEERSRSGHARARTALLYRLQAADFRGRDPPALE